MDLGLGGKRALVTGGSRGLGKAIARELTREGVGVAICARHGDDTKATAEELSRETGGTVVAFRADMSSQDDITKLVSDAAAALGSLDILVNNAARYGGAGGPDSLAQLNEPMLYDDFNVKVVGYLRCAQAVVPHMERGGWGRIVNMAGMAARNAASVSGGLRNAAVMNFTKVLSEELGPKGITVNAVHPGLTYSDALMEQLQARAAETGRAIEEQVASLVKNNAIRRLVTSEEIASIVTFLCSEQAACITGEAVASCGGNSRAVFY